MKIKLLISKYVDIDISVCGGYCVMPRISVCRYLSSSTGYRCRLFLDNGNRPRTLTVKEGLPIRCNECHAAEVIG